MPDLVLDYHRLGKPLVVGTDGVAVNLGMEHESMGTKLEGDTRILVAELSIRWC